MVQLSAAGLGVPSGAAYGLADALRQGTQGFMQGQQMKLQQDRAKRDQAMYEQALKEAQYKLGQEQSQAQAQQQAGDLLGQSYTQPNTGGAVGTNGPVLPSEQSKQADFANLQKHHEDVMKQAGAIAGKLDPRYVQQFWSDINAGMKQDAMNLARIHVGDSLHDAIANGSLDIVDPRTGERVPSPEMQQQFGDMADRVKAGDLDPIQAQQMLDQTRAKLNAEAGQVQHRLMLAEGAMQQIQEGGPATVTPFQLSTIDALRTGQISAEQWQGMAPYVLSGMVPDPSGGRGWMTPEHAAQEAAKMKADIERTQSQRDYNLARPGIEQQRIDQKDRQIEGSLKLGGAKLSETERHNKATEANAQAKGDALMAWRREHVEEMKDKNYAARASAAMESIKTDPEWMQADKDNAKAVFDKLFNARMELSARPSEGETPQQRLARLKAKNGMK